MDTKDFEYLVEIARQESLSKAAARLYLSQPTLTKFLKKIEAEYGTPLFDRVGKDGSHRGRALLRPEIRADPCAEPGVGRPYPATAPAR